MPMGPYMYIFLSIDAVLVYHQSGFSGCLCVWVLVLTSCAHGGGWMASMLSFMCFVRRVMNSSAGTLCGVGMFGFFAPCCLCFLLLFDGVL